MKTISFYSYKGGAGRTSTVYNSIPLLAKKMNVTKENPILVLDMDFQSAGITYLLNLANKMRGQFDIIDYFSDNNAVNYIRRQNKLSEHEYFKRAIDISELLGLGAGLVYFFGIDDKKTDIVIENQRINNGLKNLIEGCEINRFSAVVIDAASGNQDVAKSCVNKSDIVVCCMKLTKQFREGTISYLNNIIEQLDDDKELILLPTVVPMEKVMHSAIETKQQFAIGRIRKSIKNYGRLNKCIDLTFLNENQLGIPEVQLFKWEETLLNTKNKRTQDEELALERYTMLAQRIADIEVD